MRSVYKLTRHVFYRQTGPDSVLFRKIDFSIHFPLITWMVTLNRSLTLDGLSGGPSILLVCSGVLLWNSDSTYFSFVLPLIRRLGANF